MTYDQALNQLQTIGLKEKFLDEFEEFISAELLDMMKESDRIHSIGSLIRLLLDKWERETDNWVCWQKVLIYFLTPEFMRSEDLLPTP